MPGLVDPSGNPISAAKPEPTKTDAPKPTYATADDVGALAKRFDDINSTLQRLQGFVEGAVRTQPQAAPAAEPELTDADINKALQAADEGTNPAAIIRALAEKTAARSTARVEQQLQALQDYGVQNFQTFAEAQVRALPHFKRFEKEIRTEIDKLQPALRGSAQAWEYAYQLVRGRHADEMANEAAEEAVRKAKEQFPSAAPPAQQEPPKLKDGRPVPTAQDLGGHVAVEALAIKGMTEEDFAKKMGYESWKDVVECLDLEDPYDDRDFRHAGVHSSRKPKQATA